jgi:hypothetical protein
MLYGEIALHPECLVPDLERLSDLDSKFGFHNGALISKLPRYVWGEFKAKVNEKYIDGCGIESAHTEELLNRLEKAFVRFGRKDPKPQNWHNDIVQLHQEKPFYAIVSANGEHDSVYYWQLSNVLRQLGEDKETSKKAEEFIGAIMPLINVSNRLSFIDPFFNIKENDRGQLKSEYLPFFEKILSYLGQTDRKIIVEFHKEDTTKDRNGERATVAEQKALFKRYFDEVCPANVEVHVCWWNDNGTRAMHARHVLSEHGAIKFDAGFGQPADLDQQRQPIDMSLVKTSDALEKLSAQFDDFESEMEFIDRLVCNELK